jgi:hypothetical protein
MERIYGVVDSKIVHQIDERAKEAGLSRAQWVGKLIEAAMIGDGADSTETVQLRTELDRQSQEILHLKDTLAIKTDEISFLRGTVSQLSLRSLKPGEEEIKKKGWWQFWRRSTTEPAFSSNDFDAMK